MALLDTGNFAIAYPRVGVPTPPGVMPKDLEVNVFRPDGTTFVGFTGNAERGVTCSSPALAGLPGGRIVVAWKHTSAESFAVPPSVRANVFVAGEDAVGTEFVLNTAAPANLFTVSTATVSGPDGDVACTAWSDDSHAGEDTSDVAVRGRLLPVNGVQLG